MKESLYYNPNKLLSYNRIMNYVIGARGIGKTYGFKEYTIKRFIKYGEQFIYLRRYKTELKKIKYYFKKVQEKFPEHTFKVNGWELYIDGKIAGWAVPLSSWQSEKSAEYPDVTTIIFDEIIREKDKSGYMPNEVGALLNFMDTVFRDRENVRMIGLSNAVTIVNPYFLYFKIIPNVKKRFNAYKSVVVEIPESSEFSDNRRRTKFGQLIDGTDYGEMSLDNEFVNDSDVFIEKRSKDSKFKFAVVYNGLTMGVWIDIDMGLMYLTTEFDPSSKNVFALTTEDLTENTLLMTNWKNNIYLYKMVNAFKNGYLRFDNQVMRNVGYEMFKKMRVQ